MKQNEKDFHENIFNNNEKIFKLTEKVFTLENDVYSNVKYMTFKEIDMYISYTNVLCELAMCYNLFDAPRRIDRIRDRLYRELENRF